MNKAQKKIQYQKHTKVQKMSKTLNDLRELIEDRRDKDPDKSYVAKLFNRGTRKLAEKVGEEAVETVIAAVVQDKKHLISESADLIFHLNVLWADRGVTPDEVMAELQNRMGTSGLDEKAARKANKRIKNSKMPFLE